MLNDKDVEFIKANRAYIRQRRTKPVTITQLVEAGTDPFTGDPAYDEQPTVVDVIWTAVTGSEDIAYVNGVKAEAGDFLVSFPIDVDLSTVTDIEKEGAAYRLVAVDSVGLGDDNRYETLVRRVT